MSNYEKESQPTEESILKDLISLGVVEGDLLFITADLMRVGLRFKSKEFLAKMWMNIIRKAVGEKGTVIVASYTPTFLRIFDEKRFVFDRHSWSNAGALSNILINDKLCIRSEHPTNSYIGFGPLAEKILCDHNENGMSYDPIGEIIKYKGKNLMLGTLDYNNAPMAMHYAQQVLGHTKRHPLLGISQTYYISRGGKKILFTRWDAGGCSSGGHNLLGALIVSNVCKVGKVGHALSALIDAEASFEITLNRLRTNPTLIKCDNKRCLSCYGRFREAPLSSAKIYARYIKIFLQKILKAKVAQPN
jgi:aminoglycoside 3-N-acetyltransferase